MTAIALWCADGGQLLQLQPASGIPELTLESQIESNPSILGVQLLIIGRQVVTSHSKRVDLLALDEFARVHVIELKRDEAPRTVVAQILEYGAWTSSLSTRDVYRIFTRYSPTRSLETAFRRAFSRPMPAEVETDPALLIVADAFLRDTSLAVNYLQGQGVAIRAVQLQRYTHRGMVFFAAAQTSPDPGPVEAQLPPHDPVSSEISAFWHTYEHRFVWDFVPATFVHDLYQHWHERRSAGIPRTPPLTQWALTRALRRLGRVTKAWTYIQARPGTMMSAYEPLTELLPEAPAVLHLGPTRGFRRTRKGRS